MSQRWYQLIILPHDWIQSRTQLPVCCCIPVRDLLFLRQMIGFVPSMPSLWHTHRRDLCNSSVESVSRSLRFGMPLRRPSQLGAIQYTYTVLTVKSHRWTLRFQKNGICCLLPFDTVWLIKSIGTSNPVHFPQVRHILSFDFSCYKKSNLDLTGKSKNTGMFRFVIEILPIISDSFVTTALARWIAGGDIDQHDIVVSHIM